MEWGERETFLRDVVAKQGKMPQALVDKPQLYEDLEPVFAAFHILSRGRQFYDFAQPIPVSEIIALYKNIYVDYVCFDEFEFLRYIQAADEAYLSELARKNKK